MSEHKVPQDVEAEDKLLGPFSFRQFIYLLIAVGAGALAFFLGRLAVPLAIIPLPVVLLFGILALPIRKDQPMEAYLAAMLRFFFTPHLRLWDADGQESLIEISNPTIDDTPKTKDLSGDEVLRRLSFLADVADTQGWATRGVGAPVNTTNLNDDLALSALDAPDILDDNENLAQNFDDKLNQSGLEIKRQALAKMQNDVAALSPSQSYSPANLVNFNPNDPFSVAQNSGISAQISPNSAQNSVNSAAQNPFILENSAPNSANNSAQNLYSAPNFSAQNSYQNSQNSQNNNSAISSQNIYQNPANNFGNPPANFAPNSAVSNDEILAANLLKRAQENEPEIRQKVINPLFAENSAPPKIAPNATNAPNFSAPQTAQSSQSSTPISQTDSAQKPAGNSAQSSTNAQNSAISQTDSQSSQSSQNPPTQIQNSATNLTNSTNQTTQSSSSQTSDAQTSDAQNPPNNSAQKTDDVSAKKSADDDENSEENQISSDEVSKQIQNDKKDLENSREKSQIAKRDSSTSLRSAVRSEPLREQNDNFGSREKLENSDQNLAKNREKSATMESESEIAPENSVGLASNIDTRQTMEIRGGDTAEVEISLR